LAAHRLASTGPASQGYQDSLPVTAGDRSDFANCPARFKHLRMSSVTEPLD